MAKAASKTSRPKDSKIGKGALKERANKMNEGAASGPGAWAMKMLMKQGWKECVVEEGGLPRAVPRRRSSAAVDSAARARARVCVCVFMC